MYRVDVIRTFQEWDHYFLVTTPKGEVEQHDNIGEIVKYYEFKDEEQFDIYQAIGKEEGWNDYKFNIVIEENSIIEEVGPTSNLFRKKQDAIKYVKQLEANMAPRYVPTKTKLGRGELVHKALVVADKEASKVHSSLMLSVDVVLLQV